MMPFRFRSRLALLLAISIFSLSTAQPVLSQASASAKPIATTPPPPTVVELADTREQLLTVLRMSPTLTQVVATDPTLLADQDYVTRSNPQLAQFLTQHPEVTRNPDFYLFADIPNQRGHRVEPLRRRGNGNDSPSPFEARQRTVESTLSASAFVIFVGSLIWLIRLLLEYRRWGRVFRMQSEVHGKLIDRFANNQELLQYMTTDPGKRFLEAAPIPTQFDHDQRVPGGVARVLGPLQIGIVLTLLGAGLLVLHYTLSEMSEALLVFGTIVMMPGIGFIISAAIAWRISHRLGLMPASTQLPDRQ